MAPRHWMIGVRRFEISWNVMAHGDAREGKWSGNWRMEWVVSTLHTTSEHGLSSITNADAHTSAASSRLNWCPRRFKWTRPFRRRKKSGFCACAITFQTQSTTPICMFTVQHWGWKQHVPPELCYQTPTQCQKQEAITRTSLGYVVTYVGIG